MSEFHYEYLKSLAVPLPEDIRIEKDRGNIQGAAALCERRLQGDLPEAMREKLTVEIEILKRTAQDFPWTYKEAFAACRKMLPDLTEEEFRDLETDGRIDWICLNGEKRYMDSAADTLVDAAERNRRSMILLGKIGRNDPVPLSAGAKNVLDSMHRIQKNGQESWKFRIRASFQIKDSVFHPGRIRVWLPFPKPCAQISQIHLAAASSNHPVIAPEDAPQRTVLLEESLTENRVFFIEYEYVSTSVYNDLWTPGAARRVRTGDPAPTKEDLQEDLPHIRFSPFLRSLAEEIAEGKTTPLEKARAVYDWITMHVKYSFQRSYFLHESIAEYTAANRKGDCGMQALLFITLCRILGIPARWQSGLQTRTAQAGCHDWAQFYVKEYGWLYADPSYGGGAYDAGNEEKRRFYFGNLDPFRMVANSAFQKNFVPPMPYLRSDPYDSQVGEAVTDLASIEGTDRKTRQEVTIRQLL